VKNAELLVNHQCPWYTRWSSKN